MNWKETYFAIMIAMILDSAITIAMELKTAIKIAIVLAKKDRQGQETTKFLLTKLFKLA